MNRLCCWLWTISTMLLTRAHQRCWYHWILVLHFTSSTTPFSVDYKPASAYLDSPLHGSTPILKEAVNLSVLAVPRLQLLCALWAFLQGSVLGPMRFSLFISHIAHIFSSYRLLQQQYADDTQLAVAISKDNYNTPGIKLEPCLSTLHTWFCYNGLALNPDKSEASCLALPSAHVFFQLPSLSMSPEPLSRFPIRSGFMALFSTVDSHLLHFLSAFSNSCFYHIRALCYIRPNLTLDCSKNIACSLISCRLDYANSTLLGISVKNISQRLQSTLARVVTCQRRRISISKTLQELHWLPIK